MFQIKSLINKENEGSLLFATMCIMWGFTWIMGKFQINNGILPELAAFYRFLGAIIILIIFGLLGKMSFKISKQELKIMSVHGVFCTSINFILFYYAASFMLTSIAAIIYSFSIITIALIKFFFTKSSEKLTPIIISALIGTVGLIFVMLQKINNESFGSNLKLGLLCASLATLSYCIGSVFYEVNKSKLTINYLTSFFYSAITGSCIMFLISFIHSLFLVQGLVLIPNFSFSFVFSYIYLVFSAFGVLFIMILINKFGAVKTSYINLITPLIAVLVSSVFEDYKITISTIIGMFLIFISNYIALSRKKIN